MNLKSLESSHVSKLYQYGDRLVNEERASAVMISASREIEPLNGGEAESGTIDASLFEHDRETVGRRISRMIFLELVKVYIARKWEEPR